LFNDTAATILRAEFYPSRLPMSDLVRHSSPAAARMRLHRDRRRRGLRCLTIELREREIDVLIGKGLLNSETRNDPGAVCEALYAHLEQTLGSKGDAKQPSHA
jgi:hypothetical protein